MNLDRRSLLIATVLSAAVAGCGTRSSPALPISTSSSHPGPDPTETFVLPYDKISFETWANVPPGSGEMATLYGDLNKPGPYLVMMKWNPGWFSAPHTYATDRICVVVFGTWWVNSGIDFCTRERHSCRAGRICETHSSYTALRRGIARSTPTGGNRHLRPRSR